MSVAIDISEPYCVRGEVFARRSVLSLSQLFLKYVEEAIRRAEAEEASRRRRASSALKRLDDLVERSAARLTGEPYRFNRADAYEPERAFA